MSSGGALAKHAPESRPGPVGRIARAAAAAITEHLQQLDALERDLLKAPGAAEALERLERDWAELVGILKPKVGPAVIRLLQRAVLAVARGG